MYTVVPCVCNQYTLACLLLQGESTLFTWKWNGSRGERYFITLLPCFFRVIIQLVITCSSVLQNKLHNNNQHHKQCHHFKDVHGGRESISVEIFCVHLMCWKGCCISLLTLCALSWSGKIGYTRKHRKTFNRQYDWFRSWIISGDHDGTSEI